MVTARFASRARETHGQALALARAGLTAVVRATGPLPDAEGAIRASGVDLSSTSGRLNTIYAQTAADLEWILAAHRQGRSRAG